MALARAALSCAAGRFVKRCRTDVACRPASTLLTRSVSFATAVGGSLAFRASALWVVIRPRFVLTWVRNATRTEPRWTLPLGRCVECSALTGLGSDSADAAVGATTATGPAAVTAAAMRAVLRRAGAGGNGDLRTRSGDPPEQVLGGGWPRGTSRTYDASVGPTTRLRGSFRAAKESLPQFPYAVPMSSVVAVSGVLAVNGILDILTYIALVAEVVAFVDS